MPGAEVVHNLVALLHVEAVGPNGRVELRVRREPLEQHYEVPRSWADVRIVARGHSDMVRVPPTMVFLFACGVFCDVSLVSVCAFNAGGAFCNVANVVFAADVFHA